MHTFPGTHFDVLAAAHQTMLDQGFQPDFPPEVQQQVSSLPAAQTFSPNAAVRDLRNLLWSSIDNDTSRDLDQIEWAEQAPDGSTRVLIGIADVDQFVPKGSPADEYAAAEATSVYTGVKMFPMLPERLSTDLTSLLEGADKYAVIIEIHVAADGSIPSGDVYCALVRNRAQLTYNAVGDWLEGRAPTPPKVAASADLQAQLHLQDAAAQRMRLARFQHGALNLDTVETQPVITNGAVSGIQTVRKNRASQLIEDFMIAANEVVARMLSSRHVSSIRRIVKTPERWPRIVELAKQHGETLPDQPDSGALNTFLLHQRQVDPVHSADLSLAVIKLMGPGQYVLDKAGEESDGHFGLAVQDYTHSTAPNRRFTDLVTQRLLKAVQQNQPVPYTDEELDAIARNCTLKEDAARKVERVMNKRISALALVDKVGQTFNGVVTGVTPKGTFVRVFDPPVEGRLVHGETGVDVGDKIQVKLLNTDPARGFIDFGR